MLQGLKLYLLSSLTAQPKWEVCICVVSTFFLLMALRENMDESLVSAMETPGRSIFSSTRSLCFLRSFSNFFFFLMEHDTYTKLYNRCNTYFSTKTTSWATGWQDVRGQSKKQLVQSALTILHSPVCCNLVMLIKNYNTLHDTLFLKKPGL